MVAGLKLHKKLSKKTKTILASKISFTKLVDSVGMSEFAFLFILFFYSLTVFSANTHELIPPCDARRREKVGALYSTVSGF